MSAPNQAEAGRRLHESRKVARGRRAGPWLNRAAGVRTLLCALAMACLAATVWSAEPLDTAASAADALQVEQRARERLDDAQRLSWQVHGALADARSVAGAADTVGSALAAARQPDEAAQQAIAAAADCHSALRVDLQATADAAAVLERAIAMTRDAVAAVAQASPQRLAAALLRSDQANRDRDAAVAALAARHQAQGERVRDCLRRLDATDRAVDRAFAASARLADAAKDLWSRWPAAVAGPLAAERARQAAGELGSLLPAVGLVVLPDGAAVQRLAQAVAEAPPLGRRLDVTALNTLRNPPTDLPALLDRHARLKDAAAYLDLVAAPNASHCRRSDCPSFADDRRALALRLADSQVALDHAGALRAQSQVALETLLAPAQAARQANAAWLARTSALVVPALAEAQDASQRATAAISPLDLAATEAVAEARRDWERAYALAHPQSPRAAMAAPPPAPAPAMAAPVPSAKGPHPALRAHAYTVFGALRSELPGFGAYTYVLVGSASSLSVPAVRRRFLRVVETIMDKSVKAAEVAAADKPQVNLFCVPSTASADATALAIVDAYDDDLGKQVRLRAQAGLIARAELGQRLTTSPGPFLLTLPARAHESTSDSPLLLADLSGYDEQAIADLVSSYLAGLVDEFPTRQARWKPPAPLAFGLTLVQWASGPARIVSSLMPQARAAER